MKITRKSRNITSSSDLLQYTARYWAELIEEIESEGYEVDSADKHKPAQWIIAYKNGNEYEIEVNRYSDGTYEIVDADLVLDYDQLQFVDKRKASILHHEDDYGYDEYDLQSSTKCTVEAATDDELEHPDQEYDSAATSINSNKLPAIYKLVHFEPDKVYLDFGGGRFDNGVYYVRDLGATLLVYDPYNRSDEHNKEVLRVIRENGGADATLNSNVLNVIKEPEARMGVLRNIKKLTKPGGDVYITVYEGSGKGNEGPTKAGYQLNRKTADYMEEMQAVFPNAQRKGKLIHAVNSSSVVSGKQVYCTSNFGKDGDIDAEQLRGKSREDIERILNDAPVGTRVLHIRNLSNRFNMDAIIQKKQAYQSNYFNPIGSPHDYKDLSTYWTIGGYEDPYIDKTIYDAVNGTGRYYGLTSEVLKAHGVTASYHLGDEVTWNGQKYVIIDDVKYGDLPEDEYLASYQIKSASYGGAYDVLDEYYFTRDDLVDFGEEVVTQLEAIEPGDYFVNDLYMIDPKTIHIEVYCRNKEAYSDKNVAIDMRRIKKPADLNKYAYRVATDMYDEFSEYDEVYSASDYQTMKKSYKYSKKFKSQGDTEYIDFINELDNKGVPHDQYNNIKDDGCTVFYDDPKTPIVSNALSFDFGQCDMTPIESAHTDQYVPYDSIANYVHDHYSFEELDDKYSCIDSLLESFKGEDRIAKDIIEQFVGAHNGADAVTSANDIGYSSFQDPRLQPPEYDEPEEESTEELVEFSFDEIVDVDSDGSWEYEDKSYNFARNPDSYDGDWYTGDYDVYFRDVNGVVEDMDSVLEKNMPMQAGRYRITGDANLYYNVSGIQVYTDYYGPDDYDQTIVQDGVDVEFNYGKSHIDNLVVQKLD